MASRAARKLMKLKEQQAEDVPEMNEESDSEEVHQPRAAPFNPFALLNDGDDNAEEDEEDEIRKDQTETVDAEQEETVDELRNVNKTASSSKSKKNKNKNKKKNKQSSSNTAKETTDPNESEDIEAVIREVNQQYGELEPPSRAEALEPTTSKRKPLLAVESKYLDPDAELRRMFGSKIVASDIRNKKYLRNVRGLLVTPREEWPRFQGKVGIIMNMLQPPTFKSSDPTPGIFQFSYAMSYLEVQAMFMQCVNSNDPQTMMNLLRVYPFHIDALLQVSEVMKHNGNMNDAAEMIERALYIFEKSFHSMFNVATANSRISYRSRENRAFFLALFRHIGFITRKGCWRTSLEFAKLLLALDQEDDPMGAMLLIDFYALKAREFSWLKRLWAEWGGEDGEIVGLPNLSFSIAVAEYEVELAAGDKAHTESSELLKKAIAAYPSTVPQILEQCAVTDPKITTSPIFTESETKTDSETAVELLISLYVERNHPLWKEPDTLSWLRQNAAEIASRDPSDSEITKGREMRRTVYPSGLPLNVARHIFCSDIQSLIRRLPRRATSRSLHAFDPIPPDDDAEDPNVAGVGGIQGYAEWIMRRLQQLVPGMNIADLQRQFAGNGEGEDDGEEGEEDEWEEVEEGDE
ncbi:Transcription factor 25 [Chytridiales sp. JEL 0842]|nr:Transcription factor 25 [Chytridiales sp. JEL 0842]